MGLDRTGLQRLAPAGAARNALDCALWDLEAKRTGKSAVVLAGLAPLAPVVTAYTISLGNAAAMAKAAAAAAAMPLLKIKLGGEGDAQRMRAVRAARPDARLIADANEAWTAAMLPELLAVAAETRFEVVEQPLPAGQDAALAHIARTVPICADESFRTADDLTRVAAHYDAVNIKLDKTGGLTAALELAGHARTLGLAVMVGCMVATSLSMAPALLLAQDADWVDLDGPLLLARDRSPSLRYEGAVVYPPEAALWG
jgi:L-alanine-DL-glutamate epimerase-like enolase superfamily enzyme